jgi:hypothetical protein
VSVRRAKGQLGELGRHLFAGIDDRVAIAVGIIVLLAMRDAEDGLEILVRPGGEEGRTEEILVIAAGQPLQRCAISVAADEDVLDLLGADRHDAADGAGPIDVRHRAAGDIDLRQEFRLEIEFALAAMAGDLEILAGAVDDDGDAAEILEAAEIDARARIVGIRHRPHAGDAGEHVGEAAGQDLIDLCGGDDADAGQRLARLLVGFRRENGERIEIDDVLRRGTAHRRACGQCREK